MATSLVVEHLAELTGFRDRDVLDVTLIGALRDLVQPRAVAIYRAVGEAGEQRWLTRARLAPVRVFRNFQALLDYSERDTLTGLLNRKTFDESFLRIATHAPPPALALPATVIGRQAPSGSSWLGVIDIDHDCHQGSS